MSIKDFLLARIAEDEEEGRALQGYTDYFIEEFGDRLLAECAAKRKIVEVHESYFAKDSVCMTCREIFNDESEDYPCQTIRAIASVYSDHPDYDASWALPT